MPTARSGAAVGVINGTIHVAGGSGKHVPGDQRKLRSAKQHLGLRTADVDGPNRVRRVVDSKLYVVGGNTRGTIEVFDPSLTARITISAPINLAPFANAGGPYLADLGAGVTLNGSGSSDADASDAIVQYSWTIDGTLLLSGVNPIVTAAQLSALGAGPHTVSLTVTDTFGATGTASTTLSIYNNVPTASFTVNPNPAACNQMVSFNAFGSSAGRPDRQIVQYAWNFGDGTTQSSAGRRASTMAMARSVPTPPP